MIQPIFSNRITRCRDLPTNIRKVQVKIGQIVYYNDLPMCITEIVDYAYQNSKSSYKIDGYKSNASDFLIYYHLAPLVKNLNGSWRKKKFRGMCFSSMIRKCLFLKINKGFLFRDVSIGEFCLTHAESKWAYMRYGET
jgi:hypothetical protein